MSVFIAVGIPGVGKTSVINEALKLAADKGLDVVVVNYGDKMVEEAVKHGWISGPEDRDKMRKLPINVQVDLQVKAAESIHNIAKDSGKIVIVDTHVFIRTPYTFLPGIPNYVLDALKPRGIIVIVANPEDVASRRAKDKDIRDRDVEAVASIKLHQDLTLYGAAAVSIFSGANLVVIENKEGQLNEAAERFFGALMSISGKG